MCASLIQAFATLATLIALQGCNTAPKSAEGTSTAPVSVGELQFNSPSENSAETLKKPYVILISIDGYRHDYNHIFSPPRLTKLAQDGVTADSLRPVYPSKTFPNHFSLITGMTADHHGIVSNEFYDPARDAVYSLPDRAAVEDGSWYFGEPFWTTAEKQGMRTASYFWVGSEADIQGQHPNYYYRYDDKVPYETRVDQAVKWLQLSENKRPHFITLYFEGVDAAAHRFGTGSPEEKDAVAKVDAAIGRLQDSLAPLHLPVNFIVVSDHGMQDLDPKKVLVLDQTAEAARILTKFQIFGRGPQMLLYLRQGEDPATILEAQRILNSRAKNFRVWRRDQMAHFNYTSTPRVGDLIVEADLPFSIGTRAHVPSVTGANHGWDPQKYRQMHGIFIANGPAFRERTKIPTVDNVNVYPLMLKVLGLQQRVPSDGQFAPFVPALKPEPVSATK